jgi:type IV pilus assembly protein PilM
MTSWNPITVLSNRVRASAAADVAAPPATVHRPLGFTDVRAPEAAPVPVESRSQIGFAPAPEHGPGFRTEISFRRQPRVLPLPPALDLDVAPTALPVVGRPVPTSAPPIVAPMAGPSPEWLPLASSEEKVPFYKREISLRRRKAEDHDVVGSVEDADDREVVEESVEPERAPFGFGADLHEVEDDVDAEQAPSPQPEIEIEPEQELEVFAVEKHVEQQESEPVEDGIDVAVEPVLAAALMTIAEEASVDENAADEPVAEDPVADAPADEQPVDDPVTSAAVKPAKNGRRSLRTRPAGTATKKSRGRSSRGGRKVVGLKIGASQLAAAVVSESEGRHELLGLARTALEPGIVVDGEVRDAPALVKALRSFFDDNSLPKRDVRIGLASNRIGVRTFEMSGIEDDERFDNAVRFKAHEVLPVAVHESVLDYRIVDERASETGEPVRRVLLVVAPRDQVEPYVAVCQDAGLRLAGIDLEALGLLRAFVEPRPFSSRAADDTATVVVTIGHEVTTLLVAGGGSCEFTRVFDWGGGTLQAAIAHELDVHPAEAATILRHLSLSGAPKALASLNDEARARALEAVRGRLTPFARELVSSLQFYQTQSESLGIGEIVITGGTSGLVGLAEALHQMIGVSVRVGDPLQRVISTAGFESSLDAYMGSLAVPIGLAIEDDTLRSVNLIPRELETKERRGAGLVKIAVPVAAAVPLAALAFTFVQTNGTVSEREVELSTVRAQIVALPEPKRPQIDPSLAVSEIQRASALAAVLGGRVSWDGVLRDVSLVLPGNVSLTRLSAQMPQLPPAGAATAAASTTAPAPPVAPTGVQIEGYTDDQVSVARLLARLRTVPSLSNVQLRSSALEEVGKNVITRFVVLADMAGGPS